MKLVEILFTFLAVTLIRATIIESESAVPVFSFPTLDVPNIEFKDLDLSDGCGGIGDCLGFIGFVIYNIGAGFVFIVLFLINLFVYALELITLIVSISFQGVEGAPFIVNALLSTPFLMAIALILFKLPRKGDSES